MRRAQRVRLGAIIYLGTAAVLLALAVLYVIVRPLGSSGAAGVAGAFLFILVAGFIGVALADLRYARMLERTGRR